MNRPPEDLYLSMLWHPVSHRWTLVNREADVHRTRAQAEQRLGRLQRLNPDKAFRVWRFAAVEEGEAEA